MKRKHNILLAFASLLAFGAIVSAEGESTPGPYSIDGQINETKDGQTVYLNWPKDNGVHQASDFAYSKDISSPQSDGTYWIKLESFSTGSATYVESAVPADIVLVLDLSSSMADNFIAKDDYYGFIPPHTTPAWRDDDWNSAGNAYQDQENNGWTVYYKYNEQYYQVYESQTTSGRRTYYYMYFTANNQRYYLTGNTIQAGTANNYPTNVTSNTGAIYTGELYIKGETRLHALKRATCDFIDVIENNDKYEDEAGTIERTINGVPTRLGNRISIITFWSQANLRVSLPNGALNDASPLDPTISTAQYLKNQVNAWTNGSGTRPDLGIDQANIQLRDNPNPNPTASKTVVVFTDGEPYPNNNNANYNTAINSAYTSKNTYEATVFTVGLFSSEPTSGSTLRRFMNYMSSNAPTAQTISDSATTAGFTDETPGYYKDASGANADLSAVFQEIAHQSGGSQTSLSASSSNADVISNSFTLPEGANASNIQDVVKIFVAKLNNIDVNGKYVFDEEYIIKDANGVDRVPDDYLYYELDEHGERVGNPIKVSNGITVTLSGTNTIKVTGFDYSSCFCGPVYEDGWDSTGKEWSVNRQHVDHYQGYKIIIMIPIKMNPDAVGGPDVKTNGAGSGIFVNDGDASAFISFDSPTVSLPVNIHIKKIGLSDGESAKFRIDRAQLPDPLPANFNPATYYSETDWSYVSTVFVTEGTNSKHDTDGNPVVKVRGLPANQDVTQGSTTVHKSFVYRVTEEGWSWSYETDPTDPTHGLPQYTITSNVENPFTFTNSLRDNINVKVRHAESKATNHFDGTANHTVYDDSKDNGR